PLSRKRLSTHGILGDSRYDEKAYQPREDYTLLSVNKPSLTPVACILMIILFGFVLLPLAPIARAETLGAWTATTNFPSLVQGNSCVGYGGDIYCVGGPSSNAVYYAPLSAAGIGAWTATTNYPTNIYFPSC